MTKDEAQQCVACEGKPSRENNPCAVCGKPAQQEPVAHCEGGPEFCPVCRAETRSLALAAAIGYVQRNTPPLVSDEICNALKTSPQKRKPLTDVIKAAQGVLEWTEIAHRPPKRDQLEAGRMVMVRLHALADLRDALTAHGIKENT